MSRADATATHGDAAAELDAATRSLAEADEAARSALVASRKMSARAADRQAAMAAARSYELARTRFEAAHTAHAEAEKVLDALPRDARPANEVALEAALALADANWTKARERAGAARAKLKTLARKTRDAEAKALPGNAPRQGGGILAREEKAIAAAESGYWKACISADEVREAARTAAHRRWAGRSPARR